MPAARLSPVVRHLRAVAGPAAFADWPDDRVLHHFARHGDDAAFAALVRRHGPLVLSVCRRTLRNIQDAEDAFQAAFLLLARKAGGLRRPDRLGPWLYGVARRTALKAKARADRRRRWERPAVEAATVVRWTAPPEPDLGPVLLDAIDRLPARYRTAMVLCCLQGLTHARAAEQLGCPPNTVATRLARAKARLRTRLTRLGLAPAALAAALAPDAAAVAPALVRSATRLARAGLTASAVPAAILTLTEGVGIGMLSQSWKLTFAAAALGLAGLGAWTVGTNAAETPARSEPERTANGPAEARGTPALYQTTNFVVTAPSSNIALLIGKAAEQHRSDLALQWLGRELPPWPKRCPIRVKINLAGTGGATKFNFDGKGRADVLEMELEGPLDRILASGLPHEVMHTVLATHFGKPIPRWADEGAAILAEIRSEGIQHQRTFLDFVKTGQALPLRRLFELKDFQELDNVMVVYAQGYSVARFLVGRREGRATFLRFVQGGMESGWDVAAKECYGYPDVDHLELAWRRDLAAVRPAAPPLDGRIPLPNEPTPPTVTVCTTPPPWPLQTQLAEAWVGDDGRLAVITSTNVTPTGNAAPRLHTVQQALAFSLLDVRGYRIAGGKPEEVELRRLAELLRHRQTVLLAPADAPPRQLANCVSVLKDGTLMLLIATPKPAPPPPGPNVHPAPLPAAPPADADEMRQLFSFWLGFFK